MKPVVKCLVPVLLLAVLCEPAGAAALESKRLAEAKDCIAEEQWSCAIDLLRQAVRDRRESSRDEALYWLAHSLNEYGDPAAALQTIRQLETEFRTSPWLKAAGALRIAMAVRLGRHDVLWAAAAPPPPPPPPDARTPGTPAVAPVPPTPAAPPAPPAAAPPPPLWLPEGIVVDSEMRLQALSSLIRSDAARVIPMLREIALESENVDVASRAVFVMAQSERPEVRETVIQVARRAAEPVRGAAVRELARFEGPEISTELIHVYATGHEAVKRQVVKSLGERKERRALMRIVQSEKEPELRSRAILTLGQIGGTEQLRLLYPRVEPAAKRAVILGLFSARADGDLIRIAQRERNATLRNEIITRLRVLGTPKAKEYLAQISPEN
jgi:HEAT repeat protein